MEMDFQKALLEVGKSLSTDEMEALYFLCTDILSSKQVSLDDASNLFSLLMKEDHLSAGNPQLLVELLLTIQRPVILKKIKLSSSSPSTVISPYRKLLYRLSEQITEKELGEMKFLLKDIPRRKLEQKTTLGVFLEMEHMALINESSLEYLETIFKLVCPVLNEEIRLFRKENPNSESSPLTVSSSQNPKPSDRTDFQGDKREMVSLDTGNPEKNNPESEENYEVLCDYPMTGKRGICLIVDNIDFSKSLITLNDREGSEFDRKALKEVFEWLGYEVEIHENCKAANIEELFERISKQNHSQNDSLVVCILSHGQEGKVYGVDGKPVLIRKLTELIDGWNCRTLIGKPKMFFIQACQGEMPQYGVQSDGIEDETTHISADSEVAYLKSPIVADMLVGMSTVPNYVSFRHKLWGSWYIQSLCKNLVKFVPRRVDLVTILTIVNADVGRMTDASRFKKQMPQPAFSFRKRLVFPVPEKPPPKIGENS
ncbi:caspase-8 [Poeciliopsis prolifica]|uniref:caspase-8 n=1 Tax=Poeciliopsis prolifica TaxID=188132 RepID=UPI0024135634|nr:caspase-8 [Poeciliopsis prolifica]